jgi:hypothetical protein
MDGRIMDSSVEKLFYQLVPANSQVSQDYVIPSGSLVIQDMGVNTPTQNNETGIIIYDPATLNQILLTCSGNANGEYSTPLPGDGVKVLRMTLINTAPIDQYMGAFFRGTLSV